MRYATPLPRTSLAKFTACLARPGHSRRTPQRAAHTAFAARTACQASRSQHSQASARGLTPLGPSHAAAGWRPSARARVPARTSACPHERAGARAPWRWPSSSTSSFEFGAATRYQLPARRCSTSCPLPVKRGRRTVLIPPLPPPAHPVPPPPPHPPQFPHDPF